MNENVKRMLAQREVASTTACTANAITGRMQAQQMLEHEEHASTANASTGRMQAQQMLAH